jgi:hypothetical protein
MKSTIQAFSDAGRLIRDLGRFVWRRKVWWLVPMLIVLLLAIVLVVLGQTPLAPFIYTLF